ncbi:MAG: LysR family transcriptional regulator [Polyangiaceae bacterium]
MTRARSGKGSDPTSATDVERWDDLRIFLAAARTGSFTRAARALGTDQSTVSRRLAALEAEIGAPLFERTPRGPVPTEIGARLRDDATRVEAEVRRFVDTARARDATRGVVRVATIESVAIHFLVPRVLPVLRRTHPEIELVLPTGAGAVDLANQEADVALRFFRSARGDLVGRRLARLPIAVLASRTRARALRGVPASELPWIVVELPNLETPEVAWWAEHGGGRAVLRCTSYEVQLAAIRAGLGVGLVPRAALPLHRDLVALEGLAPTPTLELYLVTRRALRASSRVRAVIDCITTELASLDDEA